MRRKTRFLSLFLMNLTVLINPHHFPLVRPGELLPLRRYSRLILIRIVKIIVLLNDGIIVQG